MFSIVMLGVKSSRHFDLCFHRPVLQLRIKHAGASVLFCCHISCHESWYVCARKNIWADQECGGSSSQRAVNILRLLRRTVRSVQDALHKAKQAVTCFTSLSVDQLDSGMRVIPVKRGLNFQLYCGIQGHRQRFLVPPAWKDRLKIFTLNRKHRLLLVGKNGLGLKRLICTIGKLWSYRERKNIWNTVGPPVVCTPNCVMHWAVICLKVTEFK